VASLPLTEDDAFNSNPKIGTIAYRIPSVYDLLGVSEAAVSPYQSMTFTLSVRKLVGDTMEKLSCKNTAYCKIVYKKSYTPIIYYIQPSVVYNGAHVQFWFDPKSTQSLVTDLLSDELPFINAKIGGSLVDFENTVNDETTFTGWQRHNKVVGKVGEQSISSDQNVTMMWEVGLSDK
jgi:hypothetical protein